MSTKLAELQSNFARALLEFDDGLIAASLRCKHGSAEERIAIYRGNLLAIWNKSLANAYPVIQRLVGEDFFEDLARSYGRRYPSQVGDLNAFGEHFSDFLMGVAPLAEYRYMPAVAQLEWLVHQSYYAQVPNEPLTLTGFLQTAGEHAQDACLSFVPCSVLFKSDKAAVKVWQAHQTEEFSGLPSDLEQPSYAVVVRPHWRVEVMPLDQAGFTALECLQNGVTLGAALDQALQIDAQFDVGAHLQKWFAAGIFSA